MFDFKQFSIDDSRCGMKVGTDGVLLGAWTDTAGMTEILDAGTGSGLIALMLAQRSTEARITGVELDADACLDARDNAAASPWADRIEIVNADFNTFTAGRKFDLIVSNPPFFTEKLQSPDPGRASARHEGGFGVESLIANAPALLSDNGSLSFIAPSQRDSEIEFLTELARLHLKRRCHVSSTERKAPMRTLWQLSVKPCGMPETTTLAIRTSDGQLTEPYKALTSSFYL